MVNDTVPMIIGGAIFSNIYADHFWEGSSESVRQMFFKSEVNRALSQLPLQLQWPTPSLRKLLVFLSAGL